MHNHVLDTSEKSTEHTKGLPDWTVIWDQTAKAPVHLLQESLEAAEVASKEASSTKDALQSKLSQAVTAESDFRSKCHHLEAQATATASQLQEMQQQVVSVALQSFLPCPFRLPDVARCYGVQPGELEVQPELHHAWVAMHLLCRWPGLTSSTSRRPSTAPSCRSSMAGCRATRRQQRSA